MKKLIVRCSNCKKKMKVNNSPAKYKCPHCSSIYKLNHTKRFFLVILNFFYDFYRTLCAMKDGIVYRYQNAKNTYKYMKQVRTNMRRDPNWSNYRNQNKEVNKKQRFKDFFNKFRK